MPHHRSVFGRMKWDYSAITEETPVYHVCHFVWGFLTHNEHMMTRSASLFFEAYAIWRSQALREEIQSLLLEQPALTGAPLSINRVRKYGCALLRFDFIYGDLVRWLEGEYTNCNVDYDTIFKNLDDLRTTNMPQGYPKVNLDQTRETSRETLKDGSPKKGTFTLNFGHARQRVQYNNHKGMHNHIDIMTEKFAKEEEKSYHLCFPRYFLYFIPIIMIALLSLIMQKQKF
jgi:hypothetical protein